MQQRPQPFHLVLPPLGRLARERRFNPVDGVARRFLLGFFRPAPDMSGRRQHRQRLRRGCGALLRIRVGGAVQECGHQRIPGTIRTVPVQTALLRQVAAMSERLPVEQQLEETRSQRIQIVGRCRVAALETGGRAIGHRARRRRRFADFRHAVVIGQDQAHPGHDHVARADIAMDQAVVVQYPQSLACGPQPFESQGFPRLPVQVFGQDREQAGLLAKRFAFDPAHQGEEAVVPPLGSDLEDVRQGGVAEMRARHFVGAPDSFSRLFVTRHLGDIDAEIAAGLAIELHDLEGGSHAARTEARIDPIIVAAEGHDLFFGPEPRRRRRRFRRRLAQPIGKQIVQIRQAAPFFGFVVRPQGQNFCNSAAVLVFPVFEQFGEGGAKRPDIGSRVGRAKALGANLGSDLGAPLLCGGRRRYGNLRRNPGELKTGENRRVVMFDQDGFRRQVPVNHRFAIGIRFVKLFQRPHRVPGERQPGGCVPLGVGGALFKAGRGRIGQGEEFELARISGRILIRIDDARRPAMLLQPL